MTRKSAAQGTGMYGFLSFLFITIAGFSGSCKKDATDSSPGKKTLDSPVVAVTKSSVATTSVSGSASYEQWTNITGNDVSDIPLSTTPTTNTTLTSLELPNTTVANTCDLIQGYITPPTTGKYTFWIAGDDAAQLWLSTNSISTNATQIASFLSWTNFREWNKFSTQQSKVITLQAGTKYYFKILHKQGGGDGSVSVQWQLPNLTYQTPISGSCLSTYVAPASSAVVYTTSGALTYTNAHDFTISGKSIAGGMVPCIYLNNCYNVRIAGNQLYNSTDVGIHLYKCYNIKVDSNYFSKVSSGVYAEQTTLGGIVVNGNQFLNMVGPFPRGQFVQFNNVVGAGCSIINNLGQNILGQSTPEDAISVYQSKGTAASPILVNGNSILGGGPSSSGGGIMLGDNGGSYETASNNKLVNPGEYGMAIAGGDHNSIINNSIYGASQYFTNVGIYVDSINGYTITSATVTGNLVLFYNSSSYENNSWLAPGTATPTGWTSGNTFGANLSASLLPSVLVPAR